MIRCNMTRDAFYELSFPELQQFLTSEIYEDDVFADYIYDNDICSDEDLDDRIEDDMYDCRNLMTYSEIGYNLQHTDTSSDGYWFRRIEPCYYRCIDNESYYANDLREHILQELSEELVFDGEEFPNIESNDNLIKYDENESDRFSEIIKQRNEKEDNCDMNCLQKLFE